ncbi:3-deoxy-D-manno-octulosonic acid transferase [Psychrobacter urativorans]|uniref:3-deoxy-D-manno-octulosonic acid transferase n=1 Tax=Psychrobacter urativorans TaxID=45610 RepID=UPI0019186E80|nr:3-deoxy-D-manno-octulosonic acid transferase [Psychrobacter urativorans]
MEIISTQITKRPVISPPWYYRLVISLLKPLYRLQVWQRSHKRDNYQQEVAQRFGKHYPPRPVTQATTNHKIIWCHAVSLGETNTVAPLLDKLLQQGYQIWLTNTTQTGFARGASHFAEDIAQGRMSHSYVPVDTPAVIKTFLAHVQPVAALFVETELWANILTVLSQQSIPSILVNGRLSAASFGRYQKISAVSQSMMQNLTLIIAQDEESAQRFQQLGGHSSQVRVAGSLKWVINSPKITHSNNEAFNQNIDQVIAEKNSIALEQKSANKKPADIDLHHLKRPIWIAASTHSGEEDIMLSLQQQVSAIPELSETLLIIVPRHPERFDEVAALIQKSGLSMARRSINETVSAQTQVYLADSMGELMTWFALADVALVGGSLVDIGGHNPVEPASVATPVLMGRYTQSCQTVVDKLAGVGALYQPHNDFYRPITVNGQFAKEDESERIQQISDADADIEDSALIYEQLQFWLSHLYIAKQAGQAGVELAEQQQAVLTRQLLMIEDVIEQFVIADE